MNAGRLKNKLNGYNLDNTQRDKTRHMKGMFVLGVNKTASATAI
jgi:hypothetical protein